MEKRKEVKIVLPEEFVIDEIEDFRQRTNELFEDGINKITVVLSQCKFMDSTGLGVLMSVHKKCVSNGGRLTLSSIKDPNVRKIFRLTRLDEVFNIE
ncbi:STAS domain-containing protein [Dethiothermospora halolimnae]|uniref:STAS domain-containing protein n=1 Tax=Dethiothermospora halolimnae TaxID=3114390 RepID=UPI003CCC3F60